MWSCRLIALLACLAGGIASAAGSPSAGSVQGAVSLIKLSVGSQMADPRQVVVYLEDAPAVGKPPEGPFAVTQVDKSFEPELLVVPVGARVDFPNRDDLFHNVFSTAPGNSFDLGLYRSGASKSMVFDHPGVVPIFCNIHPQMIAYILVVANPFHTRPAEDGSFAFTDVPPGRYTAVAWSPLGRGDRQPVVVEPGGSSKVELRVRERPGARQHLNKLGKPYSHY